MSAFSSKNLIIGKNGSGKTRFLKILEQEKKQDDAVYPYDLLLEHAENSFYDFLKVMENDKAGFLGNILSVLSMKNTRKSADARKVLDELNSILTEFIGKQIQINHREY